MRRCIVREGHHARMPLERRLHDSPLNASPAAVNQAHLAEACFGRSVHILFDDRSDVGRGERVEVDFRLDWDSDGVHSPWLSVAAAAFSYTAVTCVLMPPRTEKSPTTVMRRGAMAPTRSSRI